LKKCFCCDGESKKFGRFKNKNRIVQRFRCLRCGKTFSETQPLEGVRVDFDKSAQIAHFLVEGVGIRASARLSGLDESTVLNILESAGQHCARLLDQKVNGVKADFVELDELWSFIHCKEANVKEIWANHGDVYTFLATDRESKLIISHVVGRRTHENAYWFLRDLKARLATRCQLSSDGFDGYTGQGKQPGGVSKVFGKAVDYGTEIKMYGHDAEGQRRYSAPPLTGTRRRSRIGSPIRSKINTSHAERCNLSVRLFNRRFTRLTLGYSKKYENHCHAVALFIAHFNFCRVHSATGKTPAQAAGLTDHVWTVADLLGTI
jgi:transposase-like protein/IS1 family transposase